MHCNLGQCRDAGVDSAAQVIASLGDRALEAVRETARVELK